MSYTDKYLAKSNGTTLLKHSQSVEETSRLLTKELSTDNDLLNHAIKYSCLLHDIGKLNTIFQNKIKSNGDYDEFKNKFRHNEIGWAFLSKYLNFDNIILNDLILNAVYWHHGISNEYGKHKSSEILESIDGDSIYRMKDYLIEVVGKENIEENDFDDHPPKYYFNSVERAYGLYGKIEQRNPYNTYVRSTVVNADRITSFCEENNITPHNYIQPNKQLSNQVLGKTIFDGSERFEYQKSIVESINKHTTILNAPAGFGKTLMGILWGLKNNDKIIWVCPTNFIASDVYESVLNELVNLNLDLSVQLLLTGEIQESNSIADNKYESDIIITNIDNYLLPTIDNGILDKSYLINNASVVFDEYHELLLSKSPYVALFINIMLTRHRMLKANTLLLSATPIPLPTNLLNSINNKIDVLPAENEHYKPVHDKKFKYTVETYNTFPVLKNNTSSLHIVNSIKNAQRVFSQTNNGKLYHSEFSDDHKRDSKKLLFDTYDKSSKRLVNKENVYATHLLEASVDLSFLNLFESCISPVSTIQRIGRVDRFGDYNEQPTITTYWIKDLSNEQILSKSEDGVRNIRYNQKISKDWFNFILKYHNKELSLSELYEIYNSFNEKYGDQIRKLVNDNYRESLKSISSLYPIIYPKRKNNEVMTAGGNRLRNMGLEIFYTCKVYNSDQYVKPISKRIYTSFEEDFNEEGNVYNQQLKARKAIINSNDINFEYSGNKRITLDQIRKEAKKSNTPYIRFDVVYHPKYGVIDKYLLTQILN